MATQQTLYLLQKEGFFPIVAATSIAVDMSQNIVRHTETDMCHV